MRRAIHVKPARGRGPKPPIVSLRMAAGVFVAGFLAVTGRGATGANAAIHDQRVPEAEGAALTVHVEAGRRERDFHVTFERDGAYYTYFDGTNWSPLLQVTTERPFRSGVHLAVDHDNAAHLAWIEGGNDRKGTVKYRTVKAGQLSATEDVHGPQGWNECDITIDASNRPVIAANTTTQNEMAVYEKRASGWKQTILPSDNDFHKWAPSLVSTPDGSLYVAFRRKDKHPFTWQVRDRGGWTKDTATAWRSYEPNAIAHGTGIIAASMDGYVYRVEKQAGEFVASHHDVRTTKRGIIRGQHMGIGLTRRGTLILSHSDMANELSTDRMIRPHHRFYYSFSNDAGRTWTFNQPVATEPGQGHGNLAVNGGWVMLVWPDIRERGGIRYSILDEPGVSIP